MPSNIMTDIQVVGAAGNYDIQPGVGQEFDVFDIGSSVWVGVPPNAVPEVNVGIYDGTLGPAWILRSVDVRGWDRKQKLHLSRTNYIRLNNPGAAGANISFVAQLMRSFGASPTSVVITDLFTVAAAGTQDIQPAVGYEYVITDIGSSMWIGAAPNGLPDVTVSIWDGTIGADVLRGAEARGWCKNLEIHLNNTNYLRVTNTNAAQAIIAVVGRIGRYFGAGASVVMTDVQTVGAAGNMDIQPAAGAEYRVTEIAASLWVGVSPAGLPNVTVSIYDGTNASTLLQSTDVKGWLDDMEIFIDNTNYLRITDASGLGQNIGISAVLTRQFS